MSNYDKFLKALLEFEDLESVKKAINEIPFSRFERTASQIYEDFHILVEDVLKGKIEEMYTQKTPYKKVRLKTEIFIWLSRFIPFRTDVETLLNAYVVETKDYEVFNISQLQKANKSIDVKFIVKRLIYTGSLYLLSAAPKVGKSLFSTSLAVAVAKGDSFLNTDTVQGNVLYIQNEEQIETTTYERIHSHGLQFLEMNEPETYKELIESNKLLVARNIDIVLEQDVILDLVKENNISLVIIDSLAASLRKCGLSEFNPEVATSLYLYQNKCQVNNFSSMIVHHSTKSDTDPNDKLKSTFGVGGSNLLVRANDGLLKMFSSKNGEEIIFKTIPRQGEPMSLVLTIEKDEACYWYYKVKDDKTLSPELLNLQNDILKILYERYYAWIEDNGIEDVFSELFDIQDYPPVYGCTLAQLMEITNQTRKVCVDRLNDMKLTEGIQIRTENKKFIYHIHYTGYSWMKQYLDLAEENERLRMEEEERKALYAETIKTLADRVCNCLDEGNIKDLKSMLKELSKEERRDVLKILSDEDYNRLMLQYYPPKYNVGDKIKIKDAEDKKIHTIINIVWVKQSKEGFHKYYLKDILKPYREEQLDYGETNSTSSS